MFCGTSADTREGPLADTAVEYCHPRNSRRNVAGIACAAALIPVMIHSTLHACLLLLLALVVNSASISLTSLLSSCTCSASPCLCNCSAASSLDDTHNDPANTSDQLVFSNCSIQLACDCWASLQSSICGAGIAASDAEVRALLMHAWTTWIAMPHVS